MSTENSVAFRGSSVALARKGGNNCSTYVVLIWGRSPGAYRCNTTANDRARYGFVNLIVRSGSSCLRRVSL